MLADRDIPGQVHSCLRVVNNLLNPLHNTVNYAQVRMCMSLLPTPPAQEQLLHLPRIVADPYSGEQLSLQNVGVFDLKICHIGFASNGGFKPLV
jgi:hypothetical protein